MLSSSMKSEQNLEIADRMINPHTELLEADLLNRLHFGH